LLTFLRCRNRRAFSFQIGESRRSIKPKAHSQSFDEARLKEQSRIEVKQMGGKARFQAMKRFPCRGDVGQAVVQDRESVDHGVSGSPSRFLV